MIMAKIPEVIRVLGHSFDVRPMAESLSRDIEVIGDYDRTRLVIRVADCLAPSKAAETLLHEVIHACTDAAGLMDAPGRTDEDVVNPLSRVLFSVIQDNPALVAYLQDPE
jgi:hypothetical protein